MPRIQKAVILLLLVTVVLLFIIFFWPRPRLTPEYRDPSSATPVITPPDAGLFNRPAQIFSAPDENGHAIQSGTFANASLATVVFWQNDCPVCQRQLETFNAAAGKYPGLRFIAVGVGVTSEQLRIEREKHPSTTHYLSDLNGDIARQYSVSQMPMIYFIQQGTIAGLAVGELAPEQLDRKISLLTQASATPGSP